MKAKAWAEANGVPLGTLGSWCAHYRRWQAKREAGLWGAGGDGLTTRPAGFVAARVTPVAAASSVRIEVNAGAARLELHWPLAQGKRSANDTLAGPIAVC